MRTIPIRNSPNCVVLIASVFVLFSQSLAFAQPLTPQDKKILKWCDKIGLTDFALQPLVEVKTGWWSKSGNDPAKNHLIHAFLVDESDGEFTVITLALRKHLFKRTPAGTPDHEVVDFTKVDLEQYANQRLKTLPSSKDWTRSGVKSSHQLQLFLLARACVSHSLEDVAHNLLAASEKSYELSRDVNAKPQTFKKYIARDLAHISIWRTLLKIDAPKTPWEEIEQDFKWIYSSFPDTRYAKRCKESAEILAEMIAENKKHQTPKDFEKLTVKQQVAELIFQLQYQDGRQLGQPGSCDIFYRDGVRAQNAKQGIDDPDSNLKSPALQLVDLGHAAVPQLIEALEDRRFTHSVEFHRDFRFSHHALRVSDCSRIILERIAKRGFWPHDPDKTVVAQVSEWWSAVESKGEKAVLVEAVEAGDQNAIYQAAELVKRYPDVALSAIIKCAENTDSQYVRSQMVTLASQFDDEARDFIVSQLKSDEIFVKFAAGEAILKTNQRQLAVDYFVDNWRELLKKNWIEPEPTGVMCMSPERMIEFVAGLNDPAAIKSLHDSFDQMKVRVRMAMVTVFYPKRQGGVFIGGGIASPPNSKFSAESETEIEALLIHAMQDTRQNFNAAGTWGSTILASPRMCDLAGHVISVRYPHKYTYDLEAPRLERDRQRISIINQWRSKNSIELLPVPKPLPVASFDSTKFKTLIRLITEDASDSPNGLKLVNQLQSFGPAAYPELKKALQALPQNHPARDSIAALVQRLPNEITSIEISPDSAPLNDRWQKRVDALKQSTLTENTVIELLQRIARQQPEGVSGISIKCERSKPENGINLSIELTTEFETRGGTQQMWNGSAVGMVNGKREFSSSLGFSLDYAQGNEAYTEIKRKLKQVLTDSTEDRINLSFNLIKDE